MNCRRPSLPLILSNEERRVMVSVVLGLAFAALCGLTVVFTAWLDGAL